MAAPVSKEEIRDEVRRLKEESEELHRDWAGRRFDEEAKARYNVMQEQIDEHEKTLGELERREARIEAYASNGGATEAASFYTRKPETPTGEDIYDVASVRRVWGDPGVEREDLNDRGKRAIESATFPHPQADRESVQGYLERLLETADTTGDGSVARHLLFTGSRLYRDAWTKALAGGPQAGLSERENAVLYRAMSLTTTSGGFAVPFVLDPSVIPTSSGALNPYRQIGNVTTQTVDEWRGVSSDGITAAFQAEAAATTDASPTLAQPTVSTEMARAFVPYSIEIGQDWGSFASEMARMFADAKDVLEATKFAVGSGTNEPFGVITGATTVYTALSTNAIVKADLYGVHNALGPRFRNPAAWTFNNAILDRVRALDETSGAQILIPNLQPRSAAQAATMVDGRAGVDLLGHGVWEASGQSAAMTTGQLIGVVGDFGYYKIVDRIGLTVENVQHLFGAAQGNLPTGQRGLLAYWRVGAKVLHANAFRTLKLA